MKVRWWIERAGLFAVPLQERDEGRTSETFASADGDLSLPVILSEQSAGPPP